MCLREVEYLEYIKSRDVPFYGEVMELLVGQPNDDNREPSAPHPTLPKTTNDIYPDIKKNIDD